MSSAPTVRCRYVVHEGDELLTIFERDEQGRPISGRWSVIKAGKVIASDIIRVEDCFEQLSVQDDVGALIDAGARVISNPEAGAMILEYGGVESFAEGSGCEPTPTSQDGANQS